MRHCFTLLLLSFCFPIFTKAQDRAAHQQEFQFQITKTPVAPKIDGRLDDEAWQRTPSAGNFHLKWPRDGAPAPAQTEVRCIYDDKFLYISALCQDTGMTYVINSLKRDVGYWDSDGFGVVIDPANNANNGYFFGLNVAGAQTDALLSNSNDWDTNWDQVWYCETHKEMTNWSVEIAIPLRILRFDQNNTTWGINFVRNDLSNGVYSVWARVPFQFDGLDMGWTGAMKWDAPPHRVKGNYNLIPYAITSASKDFEAKEDWKIKPNIGMDAKIGIGSGMNLDLTLNPDFSQTEIDEQVVNLTRFDVQLPEKRTFFLENADLFANFGIPPIRPFFSRTIGLDEDARAVPIWGGARLTGNLNKDTRLGLLTMQTGKQDSTPARNYSALSFNRRIFGRTTISGYLLNREAYDKGERLKDEYSRNAGIEWFFISNNGKWMNWLTHHRAFQTGVNSKNWWGNFGGQYSTRKFNIMMDVTRMTENYRANMGFETRIENYDVTLDTVFRIGYNFIFNEAAYRIFPKKENSKLNFIELSAQNFIVLNPDGSFNEWSPNIGCTWNFRNTSEFNISTAPFIADVPVSFKFDDEEDLARCPAFPAGRYEHANLQAEWSSDYRKRFFWKMGAAYGGFYDGEQLALSGEILYRFQPVVNISVKMAYNDLAFPEPYCDVAFWNVTPRVEVFFARNLWWTTFLQYNTQADNFNVNSRLQWRFRPMSDLFVVYTDNYAVQIWGPRSRALVAKANYWF